MSTDAIIGIVFGVSVLLWGVVGWAGYTLWLHHQTAREERARREADHCHHAGGCS